MPVGALIGPSSTRALYQATCGLLEQSREGPSEKAATKEEPSPVER